MPAPQQNDLLARLGAMEDALRDLRLRAFPEGGLAGVFAGPPETHRLKFTKIGDPSVVQGAIETQIMSPNSTATYKTRMVTTSGGGSSYHEQTKGWESGWRTHVDGTPGFGVYADVKGSIVGFGASYKVTTKCQTIGSFAGKSLIELKTIGYGDPITAPYAALQLESNPSAADTHASLRADSSNITVIGNGNIEVTAGAFTKVLLRPNGTSDFY